MDEFGYVELTHPTREPKDVLAPSKYRAVKHFPREGSLVRLRSDDIGALDLDKDGYPAYPLVGEVICIKDHWTVNEYLVEFLDGLEEWYYFDDLIVIAKEGSW